MNTGINISPDTKIGAMLDAYPQLEEVLLAMSPSFSKLKNPVLRRTVAKVATVRQVARVGNLPLGKLVNDLRSAIGQDRMDVDTNNNTGAGKRPDWMDAGCVAMTFDARAMIDSGQQPLGRIFEGLNGLHNGQIYELTTPFVPSPIIELAENKGFKSWTVRERDDIYKTYFTKDKS